MNAPLRCRPGDLAVVVESAVPSNLGRIVRCIRLEDPPQTYVANGRAGRIWRIEPEIEFVFLYGSSITSSAPYARDEQLRPLRESDGTDEMLRIAGLPQPIETPAPVEPERAA